MRLMIAAALLVLLAQSGFAAETQTDVSADAFFDNSLAVFHGLSTSATRAATQLAGLVDDLARFPTEITSFFARLSQNGFDAWALLGRAAGFLSLGVLAEFLFRRVIDRVIYERHADGSVRIGHRLGWLASNLAGLTIFALLGCWPLLMSTQSDPVAQAVVVTYLTAIIAVRLFAILTRQFLAPFTPDMRLVHLSSAAARRLYGQALMIAALAIFCQVTATLFQSGGMEPNALLLFVLLTRTLVAIGVVLACFSNRSAIADILRQGADGRQRGTGWRSLASLWHLLAVIYVSLSWFSTSVLLLLGSAEANRLAILSFFALMGLTAVCLWLDDWAARVDSRGSATDPAIATDQPDQPALPSFAQFFARLGRALAIGGTLLLLLRLWSGPWAGSVPQQITPIAPGLTQMFVTLLIAYILWQLVLIASERMLNPVEPQTEQSEIARQARVATLMPLIRNVMLVAIAVVAGMIGLSTIGVDVVPLFAGAGVIGLAIGLGSQTLVKDVISGAFFLLDDAFRVGDYVDTGVAAGEIERAGIRSLQIRHHLGALHTVPFGEIKTITNHSRDWVIFRMDFRVPFDTDTDFLRKKFKVLGQKLALDPTYGHLFIEPLKSAGVIQMDDAAMVVRAKFKSRPGQQFQLRRVVYEAIRKMFRDEGIDVAVREVRVRQMSLPNGAPSATPVDIAKAAAAASAEPDAKPDETR